MAGEGFVSRHNFWIEDILHDRAKQAVIVLGAMAILGFLLSLLPTRLRPWRRQLGYLMLSTFALGRMMQGAHFLSHNLWTLLFDWVISLVCYRLLLYRGPEGHAERWVSSDFSSVRSPL